MADGADIALPDTGVPVELDRIYASLRDLSEALGPNGVNKDGTLNHLLEAGANALDGKGAARQRDDPPALRGGRRRSARAAGPLFDTVSQLAAVHRRRWPRTTSSSAPSSRTWPASPSPAGRRAHRDPAGARARSPTRSARSKTFVHDNRKALVTDVEKLTRVMKTINSERDSIDTALRGRAGRDRQPDAWPTTPSPGTIGSRIGIQRQRCGTPTASSARSSSSPACPQGQQGPRLHALQAAARAGRGTAPDDPAGRRRRKPASRHAPAPTRRPAQRATPGDTSLAGLMGGGS